MKTEIVFSLDHVFTCITILFSLYVFFSYHKPKRDVGIEEARRLKTSLRALRSLIFKLSFSNIKCPVTKHGRYSKEKIRKWSSDLTEFMGSDGDIIPFHIKNDVYNMRGIVENYQPKDFSRFVSKRNKLMKDLKIILDEEASQRSIGKRYYSKIYTSKLNLFRKR